MGPPSVPSPRPPSPISRPEPGRRPEEGRAASEAKPPKKRSLNEAAHKLSH